MTDSAMIIGTWVKLLKKLKRSTTFHALEKNASKAWQAMVMVRFHCVFIGSNWIMLNYRYYFWIGNYFIVLNTWSLQLTFWYKPDSFEYLNISYIKGTFWFFLLSFLLHINEATQRVQRKCVKDDNAADAFCRQSKRDSRSYGHQNVEHVCVTCGSDACNGAVQYGSTALLIALPTTLSTVLLNSL